jgi:hypothetical protein
MKGGQRAGALIRWAAITAALLFAAPAVASGETLYNQICCGNEGTISQSFPAESSDAKYTIQLADDFSVPPGETWSIDEAISVWVTNNADLGNLPPKIGIFIYADNGIDLPGSQLFGVESTVAPRVLNEETEGDIFEYEIPLSDVPTLGTGTYWLSLQVHGAKATNGEWFWGDNTSQFGAPAALRNPGDGYGTGCTNWDARITCDPSGAAEPDQSFILRGTRTVTPPPPPPSQPQPQTEQPPAGSIDLVGQPKPGKNGGPATIEVKLPGPGTVVATGKGIKRVKVHVTKAGKVKVKVKLSPSGKRKLKHSKSHKVKVRVKITFTPTGGDPSTVTKTVTFKSKRR